MTSAEIVGTVNLGAATTASVLPDPSSFVETLQSCPVCAATSFRRLPTPGHWIGEDIFSPGAGTFGLRRCQSCSLAFVNPRPSRALLNAFYNCDNYVCHSPEAGSTRTAQFLLKCVERHGPYQGKRFLDFGCGAGFLLRAALDDKWDSCGYDVGQRALASCAAQGLAATGNLKEFAPGSFDVVFLNHVFEHIAEQENVLSECRRLLGKQGKLFVAVPNLAGMRARLSFRFLSRHCNVDERHRAFPIHLFYFTPRTLSQTLEKSGFGVAALETFGLGMDEFINRPETGCNDGMKKATGRKNRALREIVKRWFFGSGLGENLLAVSQPV